MPRARVLVRSAVALLGSAVLSLAAQAQAQAAAAAQPKPFDREAARRTQALLEKRLRVRDFVPGQVVVKLKPEANGGAPTPAWLSALSSGGAVRRTSGGELILSLPGSVLAPMSAEERIERTSELVRRIAGHPDVAYVQPNYRFQIAAEPADARYAEQWHYRDRAGSARTAPGGIGLPRAWNASTGAAEVFVAVIDTGILPQHEDILGSPNLLPGFDMISDTAVANDGDGRDADPTDPGDAVVVGECGEFFGIPVPDRNLPSSWHGSHVAGTVGVGKSNDAVGIAGVNWLAGVVPVRVLGKCGGSTTDIADAIRWAAGLTVPGTPPNAHPAKVINLSLGGRGRCSESPAMQSAIDDAVEKGALIVVAAGNEAEDAAEFTPASCDGVLTVAAADRQGKLVLRYSNFGAAVDLLAPGGDVGQDSDGDGHPDGVLSYVDGDYAYYNGTSMAAPHVAGVAALVFAQRPQHTPAQVQADLVSHAVARTNAECPRPCGAGLLNADFVPSAAGAGPESDPLGPGPTPGDSSQPGQPSQPPSVPAVGLAGALAAAAIAAALAAPRRPRRRP